jgi:hypothetical protein
VALAIVAVVAVVGVWFFVLKPAPGAQFLGTWQGTQSTAAGNQVPYTMTIAKNGSLYLITQRIGKQTVGPFSAALKDGHLESTYVYTGHDAVQAAAVATVKNMEAVIYKDFKVIFAVESGSLTVSVRGTPRTPGTVTVTQTVKLTKAG